MTFSVAPGALKVILPEVDQFLDEVLASGRGGEKIFYGILENLDWYVDQGGKPSMALCLGALFFAPFDKKLIETEGKEIGRIIQGLVLPFAQRTRLPRFDSGRCQRLCVAQRRFMQKPSRRFRPNHFVGQDYFGEALELHRMVTLALGEGSESYNNWLTKKPAEQPKRESSQRGGARGGDRRDARGRSRDQGRPNRGSSRYRGRREDIRKHYERDEILRPLRRSDSKTWEMGTDDSDRFLFDEEIHPDDE